jgi:hypothetical protein
MPTKLRRLKAEANAALLWRGHAPARWVSSSRDGRAEYVCPVCAASAHVNTKPLPNDIDISGKAVALNCDPARREATP